MNRMNKKVLAFLPAVILLAFFIAGQVIAQQAPETQQSAPTQAVEQEAPAVIEKPMIIETPVTEPEPVTEPAPVVQPKPAPQPKYPTCNVRENPYCYGTHGVDEYGTPIPEVNEVQKEQGWIRSDGYFNYCYLMDNGSWTTVTGKLELGKGIYYYNGPIDADSEAPAYAVESQQWCASNVPAEAR